MTIDARSGGPDSVFLGSAAIRAGVLTREQLRSRRFRRLFRDVYVPADVPVTHALRSAGAALIVPSAAVVTGRSAACIRGVPLAFPQDPVELVVAQSSRIGRRKEGIRVHRTGLRPDEYTPWHGIGIASPMRMTLDLLLGCDLPDAVADLDAVLRAGLVDLPAVTRTVAQRRCHGVANARRAAALADPRAESRPESKVRVWLVLDGLHPEVQYWIHDARGPLARVDLAFPEHRVVVEYDGSWRNEPWALNRDRERLNRVHAEGWEIVFVTAELLRDPIRMVRTVRGALARTR